MQASEQKLKIIRVTTVDISLFKLLEGQLGYINRYYNVVGVAADEGLLEKVAQREGIRVVSVPMKRNISLWSDVLNLFRLVVLFLKEKPFIVHANTPKGSLLALLAARLVGVPHRVYTVTGLRFQGAKGMLRWVLKNMERMTCMCANKVIPESRGVRDALLSERITRFVSPVIHNGNINGVDTSRFSPSALGMTCNEVRSNLNLKESDFVFVYVGRMVKDKGLSELSSAMRNIEKTEQNVRLILVGNFETQLDPLPRQDEVFLKTNKNIRYVGYQDDVRPYLLAADVFVLPSYREGFPNAVLQAGAMGLPSVVTNVNGCNEVIKNGVNGWMVPSRDAGALQQAMLHYVHSPQLIRKESARAREIIKEKYESEDVWRETLTMYESLK